MSSDTEINQKTSDLGGSNSGNVSNDFRSTDATSSGQSLLPEARGGTVISGNAATQGQTGTSTNKTTRGQAGEGISDMYKK